MRQKKDAQHGKRKSRDETTVREPTPKINSHKNSNLLKTPRVTLHAPEIGEAVQVSADEQDRIVVDDIVIFQKKIGGSYE